MKGLGPMEELLGIKVVRHCAERKLHIPQASYNGRILERFKVTDAKPVDTATVLTGKGNSEAEDRELPSLTLYRSAIGSLMYLMICTRPDIDFALAKLLQHLERPLSRHWEAVKRV